MSRVVSTFVKLEFYREVLLRQTSKRPSFFLCDEFQSFFTVGQGQRRRRRVRAHAAVDHANIVAFQNLTALFKQTPRRNEPVLNLLGNCGTRLFLRNTEKETNQYASNLFGQSLVLMQGSGGGGGGGRIPGVRAMASSQSANMQYDSKVRKEAFTELAVPFAKGGIDYCETIVHLASRGEVTKEKLRWKVHPLVA